VANNSELDFSQLSSRGHVLPVQAENRSPVPASPFFAIPAWWRRFLFQILSPRELAVYFYICSLLGRDSLAYPSQTQIAQEVGISSLDTIAKAIKKLTGSGFLIRNTQQIKGFQRTVYQRPAPEFTLIRLLDAKLIAYDLFPFDTDPDRFNDELDTTAGAVALGLKNLLGEAVATYEATPRSLRGLLAARFFRRTGQSYEEAWAALQQGHTKNSSPETRTLTYEALIGGNDESPIFCGHSHPSAELGAACVAGRGEAYEAADGVLTDTFFKVDNTTRSIESKTGSRYVGKRTASAT
jgi:biotin operon repressor